MNRRPASLRSQFVLVHLCLLVAAFLLPLILFQRAQATADTLHKKSLSEHAQTIAGYVFRGHDGTFGVALPPTLRDTYSATYGRHGFSVLDAAGTLIYSSLAEPGPLVDVKGLSREPHYFEVRRNETDLFGTSIPVEINGSLLWIQVAQDMNHRDVLIDDMVAQFPRRIGWITVPVILAVLVLNMFVVNRALKPVLAASKAASAIDPASPGRRLPEYGMPQEIMPLVHAVNDALDRYDQGFRIQSSFTADAAHELRTPLTILHTHIDTLTDSDSAAALRADVRSMSRLVNQLLDVTEIDNLVIPADERLDAGEICREIAAYLAPLAVAQRKSIAISGGERPVVIRGNGEALGRAMRNLLENALAHTPPGSTVEITLTSFPSPTISVADDGPGVAEEDRELIFRRFWRRDRRRPGSAGLGLSIVRRIVETHGGTTELAPSTGKGATFILRFPPVDAPPGSPAHLHGKAAARDA